MQEEEVKRKRKEDGNFQVGFLTLVASGGRFTATFSSPLYDLNYIKDNRGEVASALKVNNCVKFYADFWFINLPAIITANGQGIFIAYTYEIGDRYEQLNTISGMTGGFLNDFQNMIGVSNTLPIVPTAITNNLSRVEITGERFFRMNARFFFASNAVIPQYSFRLTRGET